MSEEIKRMRYFDGLIMKEEEFQIDQDYHIQMRRMHNYSMHGAGIVHGYELSLTTENHLITVAEGLAMDPLGRELVLSAARNVDLSGYNADDYVYIWIKYHEQTVDVIPSRGGDENIHWEETVSIEHGLTKPVSNDYVLIGRILFYAEAVTGNPVLYSGSIQQYDFDGKPIRVLAGEEKESLTTKSLYMSDPLIESTKRPYLDGKLFAGSKEGIEMVSEHVRMTGDAEVAGSLIFSQGVDANEITGDMNGVVGLEEKSLATVSGIKTFFDAFAIPTDARLTTIETDRRVLPDSDTIAVRTASGALKAVDGVEVDESTTVGQLQDRGYLGDIAVINTINTAIASPLDNTIETGFYFCPDDTQDLPQLTVPEKGILIVHKEGDLFGRQEFRSTQSTNSFTRAMIDGVWGAWELILTPGYADSIYWNVDDQITLAADMDANVHRIVNLDAPVNDEDAARKIDVDDVKQDIVDTMTEHITGSQHDSMYMALRNYEGDLNDFAVKGIGVLAQSALNVSLPSGAIDGTVYYNSVSSDGLTIQMSQLFISLSDTRIWIRKGSAAVPAVETDPIVPTWESWIEILNESHLIAHNDSNDHDAHYYNLSGATALSNPLNAGNQLITNLADGVAATDAVTKQQLDAVSQSAGDSSAALVTHKTSYDHDGEYYAYRTYTGDLDLLTVVGMVGVLAGSTNLPGTATSGVVYSSKNPDTTEVLNQVFVDTQNNRMWNRSKIGTGAWSSWNAVWSDAQIQKDLSSPATGCWIQNPDGTMEQFGTVTVDIDGSTQYPYSINFPQTFNTISQVMISSTDANYSYSYSTWDATHVEIANGVSHDAVGTHTANINQIRVQWRAIGTHA